MKLKALSAILSFCFLATPLVGMNVAKTEGKCFVDLDSQFFAHSSWAANHLTRQDEKGDTQLHNMCRHRRCEGDYIISRYLSLCEGLGLNKQEVLNAVNNKGETPLHCAALVCDGVMVSQLVAVPEVDVNMKNCLEETPLRSAIQGVASHSLNADRTDALKALLKCGRIDFSLKERGGITARDYAFTCLNNHKEILACFNEVGLGDSWFSGITPSQIVWGGRVICCVVIGLVIIASWYRHRNKRSDERQESADGDQESAEENKA